MVFKKLKAQKQDGPSSEAKSSGDKDSDDNRIADRLVLTIAAINTTKELVPIGLAKGILGTMANILAIAQSVIKNKSDFMAIVNRCETIAGVLERATRGTTQDDLHDSLLNALSHLNILVNRINGEVCSKKEQSLWKRVFSVSIDRDQITKWEKDLDHTLILFNTEAIIGIFVRTKEQVPEVKGNGDSGVNVPRSLPTVPPPRPSMFFGRNDLVAELTNFVVNNEHVALIGTGGMGKSSLAKAILNEPPVTEKFAERRFFVTYDDLDPSTITFESFMTRFADNIGLGLTGADPLRQIIIFLRSTPALIVLDNAETFEEANELSALEQIPSAITDIADIPGIVLILTSRSRRNAHNVSWIMKDIPPLDTSSALEAFFQVYGQDGRSNYEKDIVGLLQELEFHPLSINLLANTSQQNGWSPPKLLERWKNQPIAVLDPGKGKLQSLSATMQLSISSPSVVNLGENGSCALAVIAFLPQGLNDDLAKELLPSVPDIDTICDVLCRLTLVYRQGTFIKMLPPIRHYVQSSLYVPPCLHGVRTFYYRTVGQCSEERDNHADIIISDHLNIEHVVTSDITQIPNDTKRICDICGRFVQCLQWHLPRPTTLTPAIFNIVDNHSTCIPKAECLWYLGSLYFSLSQHTEQIKAHQTAQALYLAAGYHERATSCVTSCADVYRREGRFKQVKDVLDDFQRSDSWRHLSKTATAQVWYYLDVARMWTFTAPADELFSRSMEDPKIGVKSKFWHWRAKLYHGEDIVQVKLHLEEFLLQSPDTAVERSRRREALKGLAEVAFYDGRLSEATDIIQKIIEMFEGDRENIVWWTVNKAAIVGHHEDYDLARELIKASESFEFFTLPNTRIFVHRSYTLGRVELSAGNCDKAEFYFKDTIEACDMQGDLHYKAFSIRGLGEIALVRGHYSSAAQHFAKTRSLCTEMGVPPAKLYGCTPLSTLPKRLDGWGSFLEGRPPFAKAMI